MNNDLEDALVPVKWAEAQIPVLQSRFLAWQHTYPYELGIEPDPDRPDRELLVAYLEKPLDPLIIGDVGAIINSVRTGLNLLMAAVVARHGVIPSRAPDFPIRKKSADFLTAVKKLKAEYGISTAEVTAIERTKAYDGGDHVLFHIRELDNLRKHQRLLTVEPAPSQSDIIAFGHGVERLMEPMQDKTILYRLPLRAFHPTKGNTNVAPEIFLNEAAAGVGNHAVFLALRNYIWRVDALIRGFP